MHWLFIIAFAAFAVRTIHLGMQTSGATRRGSGQGYWVSQRADIVDRTGAILATNVVSGHIVLRPPHVRDREQAARFINSVIPEISVARALDDIDSGRRFIFLRRMASDEQRAEVKRARIPGVSVEETEQRRYPKRSLFSHVVGFVGTDMRGLEGMERTENRYLSENRDPLVLSVDARIQSVFHRELAAAKQRFSAIGAMGILMNARTGEIIAMVSLPDFDPENRALYNPSLMKNLPLRGVYEMGSSFKVFNTVMAAEHGIPLTREYNVSRPYRILNRHGRVSATISDISSFRPPRPSISVAEILRHSSNVGSVQIALDMPVSAQAEFFRKTFMDRALDLEFGRTERPLMPAQWGPVERATISFGHGIAVTPMHLILAFNAMVNGGVYIWPTMQRRGIGPVDGARVISSELSAEIREILFMTAEEGSGRRARVAGINIGGKTSTAEKRVDGAIDRTRNMTSFIVAFPIESPQYTMLVMLDEPRGIPETFGWRTAAWNAVPTAGAIMDAIMPMLFN